MIKAAAQILPSSQEMPRESDLLRGCRFSVCQDAQAAARALDVRREVYVGRSGYDVPVPDEYDHRSYLLLAEDLETGRAVGTMRLTPRWAGPLEVEECFSLPARLRSPKAMELNRFAILPAYRKGTTFLPVVSVGLFKLGHDLMRQLNTHYMVIASKPERIWTYQWLRFERTGLTASYGKLANAEHELLWCHFARYDQLTQGHPVREFLIDSTYPEVVAPRGTPSLGVVGEESEPVFRLAVGSS